LTIYIDFLEKVQGDSVHAAQWALEAEDGEGVVAVPGQVGVEDDANSEVEVDAKCGGDGVAAEEKYGVEAVVAYGEEDVDACGGGVVAEPGLCKAEEHYGVIFFLKHFFEKFVRSCRSEDLSVAFDVTDLVETSFHVCSKHAVILKDLTLRLVVDHPKVLNQLKLLVACVQTNMWAKVWLFLGNNRASLLSVCEGQPDRAWQRHIVCVSLEIAKFFKLPCGKSLYP
jgi:hypothetical protein